MVVSRNLDQYTIADFCDTLKQSMLDHHARGERIVVTMEAAISEVQGRAGAKCLVNATITGGRISISTGSFAGSFDAKAD